MISVSSPIHFSRFDTAHDPSGFVSIGTCAGTASILCSLGVLEMHICFDVFRFLPGDLLAVGLCYAEQSGL
jgi:hypothetical protein